MRAAFWYLVFVGLPCLGLFAILRIGEQIEPPRAVHGRYAVTYDSSGTGSCLTALADSSAATFSVSQSGPHLEIALGSLEFVGAIVGDSIRAAAVVSNANRREPPCNSSPTVQLVATLTRADADVRLPGEITFAGCESCAPLPFRAVRLGALHVGLTH